MKSQSCFFISLVATCLALAWGELPKCYINIAGTKLFAFFAPYGVKTWREVKVDGTWGDRKLVAEGDKVHVKAADGTYLSESDKPVWWKYSSTTNCIKCGIMNFGDTPANPKTYSIAFVEPTLRILQGVLSRNAIVYTRESVRLRYIFKPKNVTAYRRQFSAFTWYYDSNQLNFLTGTNWSINYRSELKGKYFYGIFEKPNEFLLPGRYSDLEPFHVSMSAKECIERAKNRFPDVGFIKGISYMPQARKCFYSTKEEDTIIREGHIYYEEGWTHAALDFKYPTCYINIAGTKLFAFFAPYDFKTWREVKVDGTWGDRKLVAEVDKVYVKEADGTYLSESNKRVSWKYSSTTNCIKSGIMYFGYTPANPRTYGIALAEPTVRILPGEVFINVVAFEDLFQLQDMFKQKDYNAYRQNYSAFTWYYDLNQLNLVAGRNYKIKYRPGSEGKHFYGIFENPNEFLLPGRYSELLPLGENVSAKECIELAKNPHADIIRGISYNVKTKKCFYSSKEEDNSNHEEGWTHAHFKYPTCYINIAGTKLFGFFAPYDFKTWREVKVDGTWGDRKLVAEGDKVHVKAADGTYLSESDKPVWWKYSSTTNCIKPGIMYFGYTPAKPAIPTYSIALAEPTVRILPGVLSNGGVREIWKTANRLFEPPTYNRYRRTRSAFFWTYANNEYEFTWIGKNRNFKIEYKSASEGKHFYGIFENPNEFLLPGRYSELLPLGENVASGGDCVTLAKRLGRKRVSYNVATKKCYYSDKEGDVYDRSITGWTCAPFNV